MGSAMSSYYVDECKLVVRTKDEFGEDSSTKTITIPCYIEWKRKAITDINGATVYAAGTIHMENRDDLTFEDRVTIKDKKYMILKDDVVKAFNDEHLELVIQ